jgi:hypothetical protein
VKYGNNRNFQVKEISFFSHNAIIRDIYIISNPIKRLRKALCYFSCFLHINNRILIQNSKSYIYKYIFLFFLKYQTAIYS